MSKSKFLSLTIFLLALVVSGALVAVAGKMGEEAAGQADRGPVFVADLQPDTMGMEPVETEAGGCLTMELGDDGRSMSYTLEVEALEDAFMSHLQYGGADDRYGPIVLWLFPTEGKRQEVVEGRFDGVLAEGVIRAEDLNGPLAGKEIDDLVQAIEEGKIFADVHTRRHVPGELRGHLRPVKP